MKHYTFKTNISSRKTGSLLLKLLPYYYKIAQIQFDIKKGKLVFTITAKNLSTEKVQSTIQGFGYRCKVMNQ